MLNKNSIVYFYDKKSNNCDKLYDFCTKVNFYVFECQKIEILSYIMENVKPMFVIFDCNEFTSSLIEDFSTSHPKCFIYVISSAVFSGNKNIFTVEDLDRLIMVLSNHIKCYSNLNVLSYKDERLYYQLVHDELDKLSFRSKLLGAKYLTELIFELIVNSSISNGKCSNMYPKLALKYNTNINNIERAMRFSIYNAYSYCENKQLFFDISKTNKIPTVKEVANYILDKVLYELKCQEAS